MERKTKIALIIIVCIIMAVVVLVILFSGGGLERNDARNYILKELDGDIVECTIEEGIHMCHIIYREDSRKIGEIWIYYFPGGVEPYKEYGFTGTADKTIVSDDVIIFIGGTGDFLREACDLYNEKYGFNCIPFERPEK